MFRTIKAKVKSHGFQMGNIFVKQPLPAKGLDQIDPFLLLHHAGPYEVKVGTDHTKSGVGPHPHRGFEPISFIYHGSLAHRDSLGNYSVLSKGDTQWMTSGKGIIHSERIDKSTAEKGGKQEFIQLWVNLPKKDKMTTPKYQNVKSSDMPVINSDKGDGKIYLVAGELNGKKGPSDTFTPIMAARVEMNAGSKHYFEIDESHNSLVYFLHGKAIVNGETKVVDEEMIFFENDGKGFEIEVTEDAWILVLSGKPINEPVASYGPFVMNTQEELAQAVHDYNSGKMGKLVEKFN